VVADHQIGGDQAGVTERPLVGATHVGSPSIRRRMLKQGRGVVQNSRVFPSRRAASGEHWSDDAPFPAGEFIGALRPTSRGDRHGQVAMRENEKLTRLTRRQILASGVAMAGTIPFLPITRATAAPAPSTAKLRLTAGTRTLAVNGKPARVFGLIGPNGNPGITLSPGERFHVDLVNRAGASTIIHWHGQLQVEIHVRSIHDWRSRCLRRCRVLHLLLKTSGRNNPA
jgi:hypothetical protein